MRKKQYIKPSMFAKETRIVTQINQVSVGSDGSHQGSGEPEYGFNDSRERLFFQDDSNSEWNSIWQ